MCAMKKKVAPRKAVKAKPLAKKGLKEKEKVMEQEEPKKSPKPVVRKKEPPKAKRKNTFQKTLTAEGWKRLMMGAKK